MNVLVLFSMGKDLEKSEGSGNGLNIKMTFCHETFLVFNFTKTNIQIYFSTCLLKFPLCCFPIWNLSTSTWLFADSVLLCIRYCRHVSLHSCYSCGHEGIFTFRSTKLFSASLKLPISTRADSLTLLHAIGVTCSSNPEQIFMIYQSRIFKVDMQKF